MIFENSKIYDILKKVRNFVLPALFYVWLNVADIWHLPYGKEIGLTIFAIYGGLSIFLGISKYKFKNAMEGYLGDMKGDDTDDLLEFDESGADFSEQ